MNLQKFLLHLWHNKGAVRALKNPESLSFIKFAPPGHFYSPLPDFNEINIKAEHIFDTSKTELLGIEINKDFQVQLLSDFHKYHIEIPFPEKKLAQWRYYFDNPFFSYGDATILYCFLRFFSPKRVIEVGSGFSSSAMLDVNDNFLEKTIEFTFIEPFPERLLNLLSVEDQQKSRIEIMSVQEVDLKVFKTLQANDILFIDSSHVGKINSDVLHLISNVLPSLNNGVIVHFHDILWPFEYPKNWLDEGRAWNESYILKAFLQYNSAFEILYFNSYMALHNTEILRRLMPIALKKPSTEVTHGNTSLWLRKVS